MTDLGRQPTYPRSKPRKPQPTPAPATTFDPLRYCIFTTIAVLAWTVGPAPTAVIMSGLGLLAYGRAWRGGLRQSRCVLGDVRLVVAYLGVVFIAGAAGTAGAVLRLVR